ncbi:hypothetical protein GCM10027048_15990 [Hymenobacter coalescens]
MLPRLPASRYRALLAGAALLLSLAARAQGPALDPTFQPVRAVEAWPGSPSVAGIIRTVVRQPDGKYLVGGLFNQLNGVMASNVARLLPDGRVDPGFAPTGTDGEVRALVLQPDGSILVGGAFSTLAGSPRLCLGRLLPNGTLDPAFDPPSGFLNDVPGVQNPWVNQLDLLPDGQVLVGGVINLLGFGASSQRIIRVSGRTGQPDPGFQPFRGNWLKHLLLPDGKILVGAPVNAYQPGTLLQRLNANGTPDLFYPPLVNTYASHVWALVADGAGNVYAGGLFNSAPGGGFNGETLRRLLPDGRNDATFRHRGTITDLKNVAVQPNGRVLTANSFIERLQPDGAPDAGFVAANAPQSTAINGLSQLLVQPDGAIVVAGQFTQAGVSGPVNLVRLLDAHVLAVKPRAAGGQLTAWPQPAREVLHLRLESGARAQQVQLLDALGRVVRNYPRPVTPELTLPVADLPAGSYQLHVEWPDGRRAVRRVVLR